LISSFTAAQTAVFSLSLSRGRSAALPLTNFAPSAWRLSQSFQFSRIAPRTAIFSRSLPDDRSTVLVTSFTASHTTIFSLSLPPGQSAFFLPTNAATALSDDGESTRPSLLLVILLPLVAALIAFAVGFLVFLRIRGYANCRRNGGFNDSDESPPRTLDFCSDSGLTVNTTLTTTLVDGDDSQWIPPAGGFSASGFGPFL
jgi:hypothetical protein